MIALWIVLGVVAACVAWVVVRAIRAERLRRRVYRLACEESGRLQKLLGYRVK